MLLKRVIFGLLVLAAYGAISYNVAVRQFVPTGDEPHYLMIIHSIAVDGDISLLNNYRQQHYRLFYPSLLPKRTTASADKQQELPTFGIGMPLFLSPWYKLLHGHMPQSLVAYLRFVVCIVAAFGIFQLLSLGLDLSGRFVPSLLVTGVAAFSSPLVTYSNQFYPEIFAFTLLITALRMIKNRQKNPWLSGIVLALIPGMLMWLHPKYLALAVVLTGMVSILFFYDRGKKISSLQWIHVIVAFLGIFSFFLFLHSLYGSWSPNRIYGGWQKQSSLFELLRNEGFDRLFVMIKMFFGFWFDERFGLLPYSPFYVACFAAIAYAIRQKQTAVYPALILFAFHFVPLCWGAPLGGYSPPVRHFVVMTPLVLVPVFMMNAKWIREQLLLFVTLQLTALWIAFQMLTNYRKIFSDVTWRNPDGGSEFWRMMHLAEWIPNCIATNPEYLLIAFWCAGAAFLGFCLYPRTASK